MNTPTIDIDFKKRLFSLPFGLAPTVNTAFVSGLSLETDYLLYPRGTAGPCWPPSVLEVTTIPFADESGTSAVLPASTRVDLGVAATRVELQPALIAQVASKFPTIGFPGFRWDEFAMRTGPLPLPAYEDGALVLHWQPRAATVPSGNVTPGVIENSAAEYLLATHAAGGNGEATPDLLRSPVVGLVRFERYRHLQLRAGALSVGDLSSVGAIVIRSRAGGITPPPGNPPVLGSVLISLENIDRASAVQCISRLVWCSIIRYDDIKSAKKLEPDAGALLGLLVQSWLDYLHVARQTHRPAMDDPLPLLAPAIRAPFEKVKPSPTRKQVEAVLDKCFTDSQLRLALVDFVTSVFAEIICGASWSEIQVTAVVVAPPSALADSHARLRALSSTHPTFVPCYAGAPVGRAASVLAPAGQPPKTNLAAQNCLSPFYREALAAAGHGEPATQPYGTLAVLRVLGDTGGNSLLTTRDFLDALVKGSNTTVSRDPEVDFAALASLGHPFATAVDWTRFSVAQAIRANLDALHGTAVRGKSLAKGNIDFWSKQSNLLDAGNWPQVGVDGIWEKKPSPETPFATRKTRALPAVSGFDEYDLEAVLRAREVVRDGRNHKTGIPVPLFLALLDRESYRAFGIIDRTAEPFGDINVGMPANPSAKQLRSVALTNWLVYPFGLDLLTAGTPITLSPTGFPLRHLPNNRLDLIPDRFATSFPSIRGELEALGLLAADLEPLLKEADCLDYLGLRIQGKPRAPAGITFTRRSRSAQWMGIALLMAIFQWVHGQLCRATRARHTPGETNNAWVRVDEFVSLAADPPAPGANANSMERRTFLAYWATVYLAFNTSPPTWNKWVDSVSDAKIAAGTSVSVSLLHRRNSAPRSPDGPVFATPEGRALLMGQRGHMVRFAAGLDAYMRLGVDGTEADISDPDVRGWPLP